MNGRGWDRFTCIKCGHSEEAGDLEREEEGKE